MHLPPESVALLIFPSAAPSLLDEGTHPQSEPCSGATPLFCIERESTVMCVKIRALELDPLG